MYNAFGVGELEFHVSQYPEGVERHSPGLARPRAYPGVARGSTGVGGVGYAPTMPQSLANVLVHIVFSTRDRQPLLADSRLRVAMHKYLATVSGELRCQAITVGGVGDDHVHILARQARTITLAGWVRELKRASSLWAKGLPAGTNGFQWQAGYGAFSVSQSQSSAVERYILGQEAHHTTVGFQDEFRTLLDRHHIAYDERYLWD